MSQDRLITWDCTACKRSNYYTKKSKLQKEKLEHKKFCKHCKKHTPHKEGKVKK